MSRKKSKLEQLTKKQIENITLESEKNHKIPLIKSSQINMRLRADQLDKAKKLAKANGMPYTTFLSKLLTEDIERLWSVYKPLK